MRPVYVGRVCRLAAHIPAKVAECRLRHAEKREAEDKAIKRAIRRSRQWAIAKRLGL